MSTKISKLKQKIDNALLEDKRTMNEKINTIENNGIVTLSGKVDSNEVKQVVESIVTQQEGVESVINEIQVITYPQDNLDVSPPIPMPRPPTG